MARTDPTPYAMPPSRIHLVKNNRLSRGHLPRWGAIAVLLRDCGPSDGGAGNAEMRSARHTRDSLYDRHPAGGVSLGIVDGLLTGAVLQRVVLPPLFAGRGPLDSVSMPAMRSPVGGGETSLHSLTSVPATPESAETLDSIERC